MGKFLHVPTQPVEIDGDVSVSELLGRMGKASFAEAQSWGKIAADATSVTVYSDVTIALPIIVAALQEDIGTHVRSVPQFSMERDLGIKIKLDG